MATKLKKTCGNCTYLISRYYGDYFCAKHRYMNEYPSQICELHKFNCMSDNCLMEAEYIYEGKAYCSNCLIDRKNVKRYSTIEFYKDGEYLGTDENISEVIDNLYNDEVKSL